MVDYGWSGPFKGWVWLSQRQFQCLKAVSSSFRAEFSPLEGLIQFAQSLIWLYRAVFGSHEAGLSPLRPGSGSFRADIPSTSASVLKEAEEGEEGEE
jgi:hypothetical protein